MTGERYFHAAESEAQCFKRAVEQWKFCARGSKKGEGVAAIYGPTGAMTYGGEGCFTAVYGCPKHGGPIDGHVVNGSVKRDSYAERERNAAHDQEKCLERAPGVWNYCGSHPNHTVTMIYLPTGVSRTAGAGCWIRRAKCPKKSYLHNDYEEACLERAEYFWTTCGSDRRYPVTAHYRPTTRFVTYP